MAAKGASDVDADESTKGTQRRLRHTARASRIPFDRSKSSPANVQVRVNLFCNFFCSSGILEMSSFPQVCAHESLFRISFAGSIQLFQTTMIVLQGYKILHQLNYHIQ